MIERKLSNLILQSHEPSSWETSFILSAALWSKRSHDLQTQCGAVLVKNKRIISTGYNGFISGIDDSVLPRKRPDKYPFMIHAEANAVYNAAKNGVSTIDSECYVTAVPCLSCVQMLHQCGIKKVIFSDISSPKMEIYSERYDTILKLLSDQLELKYVPKSSLDTDVLECILETFKKNEEPS
jgi:deoxycytidylate deaminase